MVVLSCVEFGHNLLNANDLDPVYALLWGASLPNDRLRRWLLAYWCFYHVGTASWITDSPGSGDGYWGRMRAAAASKDYPRCPERRHFRRENARKSVAFLSGVGLEALFDGFPRPDVNVKDIIEYVSEWVGFGPWISFKVADMMERLGLIRVCFDLDTALYNGSPTEGVARLCAENNHTPDLGFAVEYLLQEFRGVKAPPSFDRDLGLQEFETILCKFNSYRKGHYHIGEDVAACRRGLLRFARAPTAQKLFRSGRDGGLWK